MQTSKFLILLVSCVQSLATSERSTSRFSSVVAFGDSFTDNGNGSYKLTNGSWPADPAYYSGRFSNGPVWVENVAANLSIPLYDYAYGGATTDNHLVQGYTGPHSTVPVPGLAQQVSGFLAKHDSKIDISTSLFIVFGGFNDIFFNPNLTAAQIATALEGSVTSLVDVGGRHFLLMNYYDASEIPYDQYTDIATKNQLATFSVDFGHQVSTLTKRYQEQLAGKTGGGSVTYVGLMPLFKRFYFYGEPSSYGFDTFGAYGSCLVGAYDETPNRTLCSNPDKMVFWDEYHPSKSTHRHIASRVLDAL
jgi:phospholipase/lecithinase/hemolysin